MLLPIHPSTAISPQPIARSKHILLSGQVRNLEPGNRVLALWTNREDQNPAPSYHSVFILHLSCLWVRP